MTVVRRLTLLLMLIAGLAAGVGGGMGGGPRPAAAQDQENILRFFPIGTGGIGGTYFPIGALIANAISAPPGAPSCRLGGVCGVRGLIAVTLATHGSIDNLHRLFREEIQAALMQADVAFWAQNGSYIFQGQDEFAGLRALAGLYPEQVHIVVRADSDIEEVADLEGGRIAMGPSDSGTAADALVVLAISGLSTDDYDPVYGSTEGAADLLVEEEIDAFFMVGGAPVPLIDAVSQRVRIRLLPVPRQSIELSIAATPFLSPAMIPADTYAALATDTETAAVWALLVVREDMSETLAHDLTAALWHERSIQLYRNGHPRGRDLRLETALEGVSIPLHRGAEAFYRDRGLVGGTAGETVETVN